MNEILNGIRIIKYYAWESAFVKKIEELRLQEVGLVAKAGYIFNAVFGLLLLGSTQIQTTLIFLTYVALGNQLGVSKSFTTLTLFGTFCLALRYISLAPPLPLTRSLSLRPHNFLQR